MKKFRNLSEELTPSSVPESGREAVGGRFSSGAPKRATKPAPLVTSEEMVSEIVMPQVKSDLGSLDKSSFVKKHGITKSVARAKVTEAKDEKEYGYEGDMALNQLATLTRCADMIKELLKPDTDMPEWVQSKITLATDYIQTAADYMYSEMKEEVVQEGRPSQRHPLEGHEYHKKTNAELEYIAKDAHKAAEAMKSHNTTAENKYRDQANDSATVRHFRKTSGSPDWYKKKYGLKEEVEHLNEDDGLKSIAKKHGMEYHPGTYGANMSHAKKGFVNINRYGEWSHHKQGSSISGRGHGSSTAHGDSSDKFKSLDKHLGTLNEESPKKNQDVADKSYLKDMGKKPTVKSDLKNFGRFLAGKKETNEETQLEEAVSRKDFQMVADLIKTHDDHDKRKMLAQHHAEVFHRQNPRFDRAKFMSAANVNEAKTLSPGQDDAPFDAPYTTTPSDVKDKSGAIHTPMSRAKDLARSAMKRVKQDLGSKK